MEEKKVPQIIIIKTKRLVVEIPRGLHHEIKTQASWRNITIRKYIIEAVIERMKRDEKYQ